MLRVRFFSGTPGSGSGVIAGAMLEAAQRGLTGSCIATQQTVSDIEVFGS